MLYREWCLTPMQRRGCMLPLARVAQFEKAPDAGYASVYMFSEEDASAIRDSGSSAGFARFVVYADTLTLDLDKGDRQLKRVREALIGYAYSVYESGGKGYHVVIPLTEMMVGKSVPYSQKKWVEALNVEADLSLYQSGHIIALPGRRHPKSGKRKVLVDVVQGKLLACPLLDEPTPIFSVNPEGLTGLEQGLWQVLGLLQREPDVGHRHMSLWSAAKALADAGIEFDTSLNLLSEVNARWDEPKELSDVRAAVLQAYRKSG